MAGEFTLTDDNAQNDAANTVQSVFEAASDTRILTFSATNGSASNAAYKAYIYDNTGSIVGVNVPYKIVTRMGYDLAPPIIGHIVPAGGSLRVESTAANSITFRVTGVLT